jgi:hypothetical protein
MITDKMILFHTGEFLQKCVEPFNHRLGILNINFAKIMRYFFLAYLSQYLEKELLKWFFYLTWINMEKVTSAGFRLQFLGKHSL